MKEFDKFKRNMSLMDNKLKDVYCARRADVICHKNLEWDRSDYTQVFPGRYC